MLAYPLICLLGVSLALAITERLAVEPGGVHG